MDGGFPGDQSAPPQATELILIAVHANGRNQQVNDDVRSAPKILINYATDVWFDSADWPQMRVSRKFKCLMPSGNTKPGAQVMQMKSWW